MAHVNAYAIKAESSILTVIGCVFVVFCYPNTAGLSIEETQVIFKKSFGIKAADRLRAEKAATYDADMNTVTEVRS